MTQHVGRRPPTEGQAPVRSAQWSWRGALYGALLWMASVYLLAHTGLVRLVGWESLRTRLGPDLYYALIPGGGVLMVVPFLVGVVLVDVTLTGARAMVDFAINPSVALDERRSRLALAACVPVLGVAAVLVWPRMVTSSPTDHVLALLFRADTVYADEFREARFRAVSAGMTERDVRALIGEPLRLELTDEGTAIASYATSAGDAGHWVRQVHYDTDGRVSDRRAGLILD